MANPISDEILTGVRELIEKITHYEVGTNEFNSLQKCVITTLKKSDTMYFLNTKDIKRAVWSMAEKFMFHGFFKHADYLKHIHDKYIDKNLSDSDLTPRLNVVKFLLCMSEHPTTYFWKDPDKFEFIKKCEQEETVVDWGAYLNEGIERWSPVKDDSYQESSESSDEADASNSQPDGDSTTHTVITETRKVEVYDFRASRAELVDTVQNGWFNGEGGCMEPPSEWFDANVGILWEQHLRRLTGDLIQIAPITVISEYKVMREVLWQLWGPHDSTIFQLSGDELVPKTNVTISSVCSMTFEQFLKVFVPYIKILEDFRHFYRALEEPSVSETYKSYASAVQKITRRVFADLVEVESQIREQNSTMTLLKLAAQLEQIFAPVGILKKIHQEVIVNNFRGSTPLNCALSLLTRLRGSLQFSLNKMEQDIRLTLYLESLYYYLTMVNAWLVKNELINYTDEFVIINKNEKSSQLPQNYEMNFVLRDGIDEYYEKDCVVKIFCDQVLQIGRNIHLLRLLGKFDVFTKGSETIHQEFTRRILEELANYYNCELPETAPLTPKLQQVKSSFDINQMGDWTDFVDLSDGFLTKAFDDFYLEKDETAQETPLYNKVGNITTDLFAMQELPEKVLGQILKDRFTISGLMVKNLLIENYSLDKQFEFLNHIFLFWDDLIFPFYCRFFEKMYVPNSNWGNSVWLTSHLQDIIMDLYPNFYEDCTVQVKDHWKQCRDSLEACSLVSLQYKIRWPLNIVITEEHIAVYKELFQFILTVKWALYTINHLSFTDLEPKPNRTMKRRPPKVAIKRLKCLRFYLINSLNTVQHYLFGFVLAKYRIQFELDFERSNDLKSLMASHEEFIKAIGASVAEVRDKKRDGHGFATLLKCVKMLKVMWNEPEHATAANLDGCHKVWKASWGAIDATVNPVYVSVQY